MPRHQLIRMHPAGQGLDALAPRRDRRMLLADVEAELLDRIVEVAGERDVRDGRAVAEQERRLLEPLVDDRQIAVDAALEEGEHGRVAGGLGEVLQEPKRAEEAV